MKMNISNEINIYWEVIKMILKINVYVNPKYPTIFLVSDI